MSSVTAPLSTKTAAFIDQIAAANTGGESLDVIDPATGQLIVQVHDATVEEVDQAVARARDAFPVWSGLAPRERGKLLFALADAMERDAQIIAELETINVGKPIAVTRDREVPGSINYLRYFAGWAERIEGRSIPTGFTGVNTSTRREPVGVCAQIVPWNFPLSMATWKIAPALVTGCVSVLKPAETTPLSVLYVSELAREVGIPEGVLQIITGQGARAGNALARHEDVDKVAFTGSTLIGREILRSSADSNLKRVSLELGGKNPLIIFPDADIEQAVGAATRSFTGNTGQNCSAVSRLLVQKSIYDEVVERLESLARGVSVGDPFEETTAMGPLITDRHRDRVAGYVDVARSEGAQVITIGDGQRAERTSDGYFHQPTILANSTPEMTTSRDEIFGPVVSVIPFDGDNDALRIANDTRYGLNASVWSSDRDRVNRLANGIRAGSIHVNTSGLTHPAAPFGGYKESGHGREGGIDALELYTEIKTIWEAGL